MPTPTKAKSARTASKSRILEEVHEFAVDLRKGGHIDAKKMRRFDDLCQPVKASKTTDFQISLEPSVAAVFPTAKAATDALKSLARMLNPHPRHRSVG